MRNPSKKVQHVIALQRLAMRQLQGGPSISRIVSVECNSSSPVSVRCRNFAVFQIFSSLMFLLPKKSENARSIGTFYILQAPKQVRAIYLAPYLQSQTIPLL